MYKQKGGVPKVHTLTTDIIDGVWDEKRDVDNKYVLITMSGFDRRRNLCRGQLRV